MADYSEKITELENLIKNSKYNKRTQHAIGLYKAQLARLKEKQVSRGKSSGPKEGYSVRKTGDATVLILGFPSVGKSTLLNKITNQESEVGSYEFTTLSVIPGLLKYKHSKIQILDVPGIVKGAATGRGRGKEILSVLRNADLVLILVEALHTKQHNVILKEVYDANIRLNQQRPDVRIKKTARNGIKIASTVKLELSKETMKTVFKEFKISNADVIIRDKINIDKLIDCIEDNKKYVKAITIISKADSVTEKKLKPLMKRIKADIAISATENKGMEELKELIFKKLNFIRIYLKEPGKEADIKEPLIITKDSTVRDICEKLHKDFVRLFKFCRITGPSAKFPGQKLSSKHKLKDEDILELHFD
ncbi:GTP-binding protein [Candidatus Woesearchaeota archaeon]|nr:GTP-binding protein [Candidatus Woesearchaeota archaeon]|tara:strand:+ start:64 stop:1155 length:1092 start_codon:yes stop_codon:yes gene_type:complete